MAGPADCAERQSGLRVPVLTDLHLAANLFAFLCMIVLRPDYRGCQYPTERGCGAPLKATATLGGIARRNDAALHP